jgi:hypothetical protein
MHVFLLAFYYVGLHYVWMLVREEKYIVRHVERLSRYIMLDHKNFVVE